MSRKRNRGNRINPALLPYFFPSLPLVGPYNRQVQLDFGSRDSIISLADETSSTVSATLRGKENLAFENKTRDLEILAEYGRGLTDNISRIIFKL